MSEFLCGNEWHWRLSRTVVQGVLGVVVANLDLLVGSVVLTPEWHIHTSNGKAHREAMLL